ncbi:flagellar protein FlgJ [Actinokineospora iranica]|uniref:Flagellar protein FlgJ n=1 Tax=Actinokineospora iranica TaxID=1271860 RepID=A0A1G6P5G3_9PSEU|nr:flagellar protein FlgJ [Actinokineospora iranica]
MRFVAGIVGAVAALFLTQGQAVTANGPAATTAIADAKTDDKTTIEEDIAVEQGAMTDLDTQEKVRDQALRMVDAKFLTVAEPAARAVASEYKIPASVTAAQSILESGWGRSALAVNDRNFFGFKCTAAGPGPIAVGCRDYPTTECTPVCHPAKAWFRVYDSLGSSFRDYGRLITRSPYYAAALPLAGDPNAFIAEVATRYATDPMYADKVIKIMQDHDLYRFDRPKP